MRLDVHHTGIYIFPSILRHGFGLPDLYVWFVWGMYWLYVWYIRACCVQVGKQVVQRTLELLSDGGGGGSISTCCLASKEYGKARIFFPDQVNA